MANLISFGGEMITASKYYYECDCNTWDLMVYPEAVQDRYERVKKLYYNLVQQQLDTNYKMSDEEETRLFKVQKAFNDTKELLNEREI